MNFNDDNYEGSTQLQHSSGMSTQRDDYDDSSTQSVQTQVMSNEPDPTQPMKLDREDTVDAIMKVDEDNCAGGCGDWNYKDNTTNGSSDKDVRIMSKNSKSNGSDTKSDKSESEKRIDYGTLVWEKDNPE